jgi:hypothetical protein
MSVCRKFDCSMYSAIMSMVASYVYRLLACWLFTRLGPDHPRCASGNALTTTAHVSTLWWNIDFSVLVFSNGMPMRYLSFKKWGYIILHSQSTLKHSYCLHIILLPSHIRRPLWASSQVLHFGVRRPVQPPIQPCFLIYT